MAPYRWVGTTCVNGISGRCSGYDCANGIYDFPISVYDVGIIIDRPGISAYNCTIGIYGFSNTVQDGRINFHDASISGYDFVLVLCRRSVIVVHSCAIGADDFAIGVIPVRGITIAQTSQIKLFQRAKAGRLLVTMADRQSGL